MSCGSRPLCNDGEAMSTKHAHVSCLSAQTHPHKPTLPTPHPPTCCLASRFILITFFQQRSESVTAELLAAVATLAPSDISYNTVVTNTCDYPIGKRQDVYMKIIYFCQIMYREYTQVKVMTKGTVTDCGSVSMPQTILEQ